MNNAPTGGDDFYAPRAPVFNPGNNRPFEVPRTEAVPRRVGRNPVTTLLTWAVVLTLGAIGAKYGYPVVMEKVHAKEIQAVSADLAGVAAGQTSYFKLNGSYGSDFDALSMPKTVSQVTVVGVTAVGYCLRGRSVTGDVVLYYTPAQGVSDKACG
ncbi:hypothetical protein ACFQ46_00825 [Kineococcus sp. GCM10028916]|uniref:hypothetical protein n=1 Tax=Kineococcus sp. GCM10028916 TaxID=3273394 RepID=UPI0036327356